MKKKIIEYGINTKSTIKKVACNSRQSVLHESTSASPASVLTKWQYIDVSSAALLCLLIGSHGSLTQLCHSDFMYLV